MTLGDTTWSCPQFQSWTQSFEPANRPERRRTYRNYTIEFKRAVVELTLADGASVSLIARAHDVNTNQLFGWRKLYRDGRLGGPAGDDFKLLPIALVEAALSAAAPGRKPLSDMSGTGEIKLEVGKARLRIKGHVDSTVLSLVLERVLR